MERIVGDEAADIFDGVIVHTLPLPGRHLFADVEQIDDLRERGVRLSVDRDALREPTDESGGKSVRLEETVEGPVQSRLRRAWDWISGRR